MHPGPRRVSGAGRDGAGAGARPSSEHKDGPGRASGRPGQCPACCGSRRPPTDRPTGRQTKAEAAAAPGSPRRRVVPARGRRVHDSVLFGAGPAGRPGARPALRGGWGPPGPELGRNRWKPAPPLAPGGFLDFSSVVKRLPQDPVHGGRWSASPFVYGNLGEH